MLVHFSATLTGYTVSLTLFRFRLIGQKAAPTNIIQICNLSLLSLRCSKGYLSSVTNWAKKNVFLFPTRENKNVKCYRISHFSISVFPFIYCPLSFHRPNKESGLRVWAIHNLVHNWAPAWTNTDKWSEVRASTTGHAHAK